jgi:hypothetical protein
MALTALAACCISSPSYAGHVGVGIYVAPGYPYYYGPPPVPYYYPPVVAVPVAPAPVYVENDQSSDAPGQAPGSWYYCDASKTYYPYVKQCAAGWREVPAQAAPSN